jgi:sortase A
MAIYSYIKARPKPYKKYIDFISYTTLLCGALFLFWSFYPILSFEIYSRLFIHNTVLSPVPKNKTLSSLQSANSVLGAYNVFSTNLSSYTNAGIWFPTKPQEKVTKDTLKNKEYALSIPKLNIHDAKVIAGSEDLAKSLIQYIPTSLPGEPGNVSIFGHSTLPQLYDPKSYKTIFTYLPSLSKGDQILVTMDDITYTYSVFDMFVVKPEQVSILDQKYDDSYLTVVTCVPPGTWWNRLVVKARLIKS